jgi:23S rRNA pseudouridine1911/1915/1917 synthase
LRSFLKKETKKTIVAEPDEPETRQAELSYRTLNGQKEKSLLEITLLTGRKHQIRAQFAAQGHPIIGDIKYGAPFAVPDQSIRLMAKSLSIKHPTRDEWITIEAPDPQWD